MLWQGCSLSPSELERKRRARFGATCVARVSPLPRSEWTPCRAPSGLLAALRRKSVGTSAAPPALRASAARGESRMESAPRPVRQSAALRGKAVGTSAAHIRRAAVRGLGTFTWGFLRHSPASVLARGKNRGESRVMTVVEVVWSSRVRLTFGAGLC